MREETGGSIAIESFTGVPRCMGCNVTNYTQQSARTVYTKFLQPANERLALAESNAWWYAMRAINNYRGGAGHGCQ